MLGRSSASRVALSPPSKLVATRLQARDPDRRRNGPHGRRSYAPLRANAHATVRAVTVVLRRGPSALQPLPQRPWSGGPARRSWHDDPCREADERVIQAWQHLVCPECLARAGPPATTGGGRGPHARPDRDCLAKRRERQRVLTRPWQHPQTRAEQRVQVLRRNRGSPIVTATTRAQPRIVAAWTARPNRAGWRRAMTLRCGRRRTECQFCRSPDHRS
jgi:hypothetical protein